MECSPPGSSVHGILQARILKWVAISFSRGVFPTQGLNLGLPHCSHTLLTELPEKRNFTKKLTNIPDISNWDLGKAENLNGMFKKCISLEESPKISNWSKTIKNIITMEKMFKECSKIKNLPDFSHWDMSNVENIAEMFKGCRAVKSFPDYSQWKNLKNTVNTKGIFDKCPYYNKII